MTKHRSYTRFRISYTAPSSEDEERKYEDSGSNTEEEDLKRDDKFDGDADVFNAGTYAVADSHVDVTAQVLGDFGRWQLCVSTLMALLKLCHAWYQLNIIFMAPVQPFFCKKPPQFKDFTDEQWREMSKPVIEEEPCLIFDPDLLGTTIDRENLPLVPCKHFEYDTSVFNRTIVSDWDLVCDRRWMMHVTQVIMMFGILIGSMLFGMIADSYGRRKPLMYCIVIQAVASFVTSITFNYLLFQIIRFILALACGGITIISFVLCLETVSGDWRMIMPVLYQAPFGLGIAVMALLAYHFRDWRKLEFGLATLSSFYILYWFVIPESPRWLLAQGQTDEAVDVLFKATQKNKNYKWSKSEIKRLIKPNTVNKPEQKSPNFSAFFKTKSMRLRTILLSINWLFTGIEFYTFAQYAGEIGYNVFATVAITGLISIPGPLLCVYFVLKCSRKMTVWIFQVITGLCFVVLIFTSSDHDWARIAVAGVGFGAMAASVPTLSLYSGELYPTLGRNRGVAFVTLFARIGSMLGTFFVALDRYKPDLTLIVLAAMSFIQLLLLVPLPDTKGTPLPDTFEDCEKFSHTQHGYEHILFLHSFTGCDTTSANFRRSKVGFSKLYLKSDIIKEAAASYNPASTHSEVEDAGKMCFLKWYGAPTRLTSFNQYLFQLFMRSVAKIKSDFSSLPPTENAAKQHSRRTYHQVQLWLRNELPTQEWGWKHVGDSLVPIRTEELPAPELLLKTIFCRCAKDCGTGKCGCRKVMLKCYAACLHCQGKCLNGVSLDEDDGEDDVEPFQQEPSTKDEGDLEKNPCQDLHGLNG